MTVGQDGEGHRMSGRPLLMPSSQRIPRQVDTVRDFLLPSLPVYPQGNNTEVCWAQFFILLISLVGYCFSRHNNQQKMKRSSRWYILCLCPLTGFPVFFMTKAWIYSLGKRPWPYFLLSANNSFQSKCFSAWLPDLLSDSMIQVLSWCGMAFCIWAVFIGCWIKLFQPMA